MFPFYTPREHQKTKGFLLFSGVIKWEHWPEMVKDVAVGILMAIPEVASVSNFIKIEALSQMFSGEFFKSTY